MYHLKLLTSRVLKFSLLVVRSLVLSTIIVATFSKIPVPNVWAASVSWVGGADTNWETAANWSTGAVPLSTDDVLIDQTVTIDISSTTTVKSLVLGDSSGTYTPVLNFKYNSVANGPLTIDDGNLHIYSPAKITHTAGTSAVVGSIHIDIPTGDLIIDSGGSIDTTGKGYAIASGTGAGANGGSTPCGGGAHGGGGGNGSGIAGGLSYGSITAPVTLGSGGGSAKSSGGSGGGIIIIDVAGTITNEGSIITNGNNGVGTTSYAGGGGGAGGTINITTDIFAGGGTVNANGGNAGGGSSGYSGGGGGGRIAIDYASNTYTGTITAKGGTAGSTGREGGAGSIFTKATGTNGDLLFDDTGTTYSLIDKGYSRIITPETFDNVTLQNFANLEITSATTITNMLTLTSTSLLKISSGANITYSTLSWGAATIWDNSGSIPALATGTDLTVPTGATLIADIAKSFNDGHINGTVTHSANSTLETYKVNLTFTSDLEISSTGSFNVSSKGYAAGYGSGAGTAGGGYPAGGGAYGNNGGNGATGITGGIAYGSETNPINIGSGGGSSSVAGGSGGGAVILNVGGILTNNGSLNANGSAGSWTTSYAGGGGGAGGTINITTNTLTGNGAISANGGIAGWGSRGVSGGGSGGRIAISKAISTYTGTYSANGGTGANSGGIGTMYPDELTFTGVTAEDVGQTTATLSANISIMPLSGTTDTGFILSTNPTVPTTPDPVHAYYLNEASSGNAIDSIGATNGTSTGTSVVTGKWGNARYFSGNDSEYISFPFSISQPFTLEFWMKADTATNQYLLVYSDASTGTSNDISLTAEGRVQIRIWDGANKTVLGPVVQPDVWYHIAATGINNGSLYLYVNGVQYGPTPLSTVWASGTQYRLGKQSTGCFFKGTMDNVKFYNSVLTSSDITNLYENQQIINGANNNTGVFSQDATELATSTTYYFKPYAISGGITTYGDIASFTTQVANVSPTALDTDITGGSNLYAGKAVNLQTIYSDQDGVADLDKLYLQINNPSGTDIEYYVTPTDSNQTGQTPTAVFGSEYISNITYDTVIGSPTTNDITVVWHITPNWTWTRDANILYGVKAIDKKDAESIYDYTSTTYAYENRLSFTGTVTTTDSESNEITVDDWTSANQQVTFSGIKVVYSGTTDIYPTDSSFDVKIINEETDEWFDYSSSGENISIEATTADITNTNDTYTFTIINIPTGGSTVSNATFSLKTDDTVPTITSLTSTTHPVQTTWYTDPNLTVAWVTADNQSGVYKVWRMIDQVEVQTTENIMSLGTEVSASNTYQTTLTSDGIWYFHLVIMDNIGLTNSQTYKINIDTLNPSVIAISSSSHANQTSWYTNKSAIITWSATDTGSGIKGIWKLLDQNSTRTITQVLEGGIQSSASTTWTTPELTNGTWYLHLVAQDNTDKTSYSKYTLQIDSSTPNIIAITGNNNNIWQNSDSGPTISWTDSISPSDDTFYITNDGSLPTSTNYTYTTATASYDLPNQKEGETTIKVVALNHAGTYSEVRTFVIRYDSIAPANVTNFSSSTIEKTVTLSWKNPTVTDFNKVIIMRSDSHTPLTITDGTKVYEGNLTTYLDSNLNESTKYYYTIFTLDNVGNRSSGAISQITTSTPTPAQPITPTITEDTVIVKIQDLEDEDKVNITVDQQQASTSDSGDVHVYSQQTIDIEVPAKTVTQDIQNVKEVVLVIEKQSYIMQYNSKKDTYKTTINAPTIKGVYDTTIQTVTLDNISNQAITLSITVDPYGYIYAKSGDNETRIANAKVSLYKKTNDTETLWIATNGSLNPQDTNTSGEYSFFIEPGEYKIIVEAKGYQTTETEWFTVEGNIIEKNIEVKKDSYLLSSAIAISTILTTASVILILKREKLFPRRYA